MNSTEDITQQLDLVRRASYGTGHYYDLCQRLRDSYPQWQIHDILSKRYSLSRVESIRLRRSLQL